MAAIHDAEIRAAFASADTNDNGVIDRKELRAVLRKIGVDLSPLAFKEYSLAIFKKLDADKSGDISYDEFLEFYSEVMETERAKATYVAAVNKKYSKAEQTVSAAEMFRQYDRDKSGLLDQSELRSALGQLNVELSETEFQHLASSILDKASREHPGHLTLLEFQAVFDSCLADEKIRKKYERKVEQRYAKLAAEVSATFALLDCKKGMGVDDSGAVSMTELVTMLECCDFDPDDVRQMFTKYDANRDGMISESEFLSMAIAEDLCKKTKNLR